MLRNLSENCENLSINTATLGYEHSLINKIDQIARAGFGGIAPWRSEVDEKNPIPVTKLIKDAGLSVTGYCRSAYFTGPDEDSRKKSIENNIIGIRTASLLGAECFIAVVGGLAKGTRNIEENRKQILEGLFSIGKIASEEGVPIALEPLHPVYASDRSLLNTIDQAIKWCDELNQTFPGTFGIAIDVYHVWWDPKLYENLMRAKSIILAFHVSDWLIPTKDPLMDRGMMGDGIIELKKIRNALEDNGYTGSVEVEIFSSNNWWKRPIIETLDTCMDRLKNIC